MPSRPDDEDDRRPGQRPKPRPKAGGKPRSSGAPRPARGDRPRTGRARGADRGRDGRGGSGGRGDGRGRDDRRGGPGERRSYRDDDRRGGRDRDDRENRGPRPPIKGKRRTFDVDSAPNERERARATGDEPASRDEQWIDEGPVRDAADRAVRRGGASAPKGDRAKGGRPNKGGARAAAGKPRSGPKAAGKSGGDDRNAPRRRERAAKRAEHGLELDRKRLDRQLGSAKASRLLSRLGEASDAFAEDRYDDARKLLKPLVDQVPTEPALRELYGLTLYRLGSWAKAVTELEEFVRLTQSTEQHPVLADCHRALGRHERVEELWEELAAASPAAALVAEGRIVYSGSLADQGRLADAIAVLEDGALGSKSLKAHHLRMRYALGDLYDRAGEQQAARRYFESVAASDSSFFDVTARLRQL